MSKSPENVIASFLYEVQKASAIVLFMLSSIATGRRTQFVRLGVTRPLELSGLPNLCISPSIMNVPDDDLYGPRGIAAQMAYKGWVVEVYGLWENYYRNAMKDSFTTTVIRPQMDALGDLRHIRNDLLHSGIASPERCGKCAVLRWFDPGERMVFHTRHILDFLNQMGILTLRNLVTRNGAVCAFSIYRDRRDLLTWSPTPTLVSARTHEHGREEDPPFKGVTVVFGNGLFGNVAFRPGTRRKWDALGSAHVTPDGNLRFDDGHTFPGRKIYEATVDTQEPRTLADPAIPYTGPSFKLQSQYQTDESREQRCDEEDEGSW